MAAYSGREKRKHRRIYKIIGTNIIRHNAKEYDPKLDEEVGLNISAGGILIECEKKLERQDKLKIKVMLTFDTVYKIIELNTEVVWIKKSFRNTYFIGCKLTKLSLKDRSILKKYTASF